MRGRCRSDRSQLARTRSPTADSPSPSGHPARVQADGAALPCRPRASTARPGWCCSRRRRRRRRRRAGRPGRCGRRRRAPGRAPRGRGRCSRTRSVSGWSISTTRCREPGRVTATYRGRVSAPPPRWTASTGAGVGGEVEHVAHPADVLELQVRGVAEVDVRLRGPLDQEHPGAVPVGVGQQFGGAARDGRGPGGGGPVVVAAVRRLGRVIVIVPDRCRQRGRAGDTPCAHALSSAGQTGATADQRTVTSPCRHRRADPTSGQPCVGERLDGRRPSAAAARTSTARPPAAQAGVERAEELVHRLARHVVVDQRLGQPLGEVGGRARCRRPGRTA